MCVSLCVWWVGVCVVGRGVGGHVCVEGRGVCWSVCVGWVT